MQRPQSACQGKIIASLLWFDVELVLVPGVELNALVTRFDVFILMAIVNSEDTGCC